jgi:hypothetical protein
MSAPETETAAPTGIGNGGNGDFNQHRLPTTSRPRRKETSQSRWNDQNPQARWAHAALESAIRRGLIEREPCEVCGAEPTDGHHEDYSKPMDVAWLCRLHHRQEHRRIRCEQIGGAP